MIVTVWHESIMDVCMFFFTATFLYNSETCRLPLCKVGRERLGMHK